MTMMMIMMATMKRAMLRQFSSIATSKCSTSVAVSNIISKHIQDLSKKRGHVLNLRKYVRNCHIDVLDMMQHEILGSESRVGLQLEFLKELAEDIERAREPCTSAPMGIIYKRFEDLHQQLLVISQIQDSIAPDVPVATQDMEILWTMPSVVYGIDALKKVVEDLDKETELPSDDQLKNPVMPKVPVLHFNAVPNLGVRVSMKMNETVESGPLDKHRYLLLLNGCVMFCLDLKRSKYLRVSVIGDVPPLLPIATLNLLEEVVPTAVSFIKWRSDTYMIGAQKLPKASDEEEDPEGIKLFRAPDDGKTSLSDPAESIDMGKLKILPLTEELADEIHVIDCHGSHEFRDSHSGCWEEVPIPTVDEKSHIKSCLAVGCKIYAVSGERGFLVFNPRKNKWCVNSSRTPRLDAPGDVWDILEKLRVVRCAGGFPYGNVKDPLYVVVALEDDFDNKYNGTQALAFLVTSAGRVVCFQRLTRRFFRSPMLFRRMVKGKIIDGEEDKLGKYKTMCSIIVGSPWEDSGNADYLSINIFSVEELPEAADKVRPLKESDSGPVELEFARVRVMERHLFKTEAELHGEFVNEMQACFL